MKLLSMWFSAMLFLAIAGFAQSPQAINYQAVVRDGSGNIMSTQALSVRIGIYSGAGGATKVYEETHATTTNAFGLINLEIGKGTPTAGTFSSINWGGNEHHVQIEVDAGSGYVNLGKSQFLSVPYALYAKDVDNDSDNQTLSLVSNTLSISGGNSVTLPTGTTYTAGTGINISSNVISNTAPDQTVTIAGGGATNVTGTYPNFTVTSTDNNTTYSAGTGLQLSSTTFNAMTTSALWNANQLQGRTVSSTAPSSGEVLKWTGSAWAPGSDNTGGGGIWSLNGSNAYYNSGNVGIGTSTPGTNLEVYNAGSGTIHVNGGSSSAIRWQKAGVSQWGFLAEAPGTGKFGLFDYDATGGSGYRMTMDNSGQLGLGTQSPSELFHAYQNASSTPLINLLENAHNSVSSFASFDADAENGDAAFRMAKAGVTKGGMLWDDSDNAVKLFIYNSASSGIWLNGTSGNVGIGTGSPGNRLHIYKSSGTSYLQISDGTSGITSGLRVGMNGSGGAYIINDETNSLNLGAGGTTHMTITNLGNVGIGTSAPANPLNVTDVSATPVVRVQGGLSTNGYMGIPNGINTFDGITGLDILGNEVGVLGVSNGASSTDNYGVMGWSNGWGGNFTHSGGAFVNLGGTDRNVEAKSSTTTGATGVVHSEFTGTGNTDVYAYRGISVPAAYYGYGGSFEGGYRGVYGLATVSGTGFRYGVYGWAGSGASTNYGVYGYGGSTGTRYGVYASGDLAYTGSLISISDTKFKNSQQKITNAIETIKLLSGKSYQYNVEEFPAMGLSEGIHYGFIAQELEQVLPSLVSENVHPGSPDSKEEDAVEYKGINYIELIPILVEAVKEQQQQIEELKQTINELKK